MLMAVYSSNIDRSSQFVFRKYMFNFTPRVFSPPPVVPPPLRGFSNEENRSLGEDIPIRLDHRYSPRADCKQSTRASLKYSFWAE